MVCGGENVDKEDERKRNERGVGQEGKLGKRMMRKLYISTAQGAIAN